MSSLRTRAVSLGVVAATTFGVFAGTASAANVIVEVQIQAKIFQKDPALKGLQNVNPQTKAQVRALLPRYEHLEKLFRTAANSVAGSSANTASQKLGKTQWVTGARTFATGLDEFDSGLKLLLKNQTTAAKQQITAGDKKLVAGDKLLNKANATLGLK